jgi:hypothetical protein
VKIKARHWCLAGCALVGVSVPARAANEEPESRPSAEQRRREVVLAVGYGTMIAPQGIEVHGSAERTTTFDGFSIDGTRRVAQFEYGARFWRMGDSPDGAGKNAHVLTRLTTEARFYPWSLPTLEPWIGGELGLALADDFAVWNATDKEPAHRVVAGVRPGLVAGIEAGARLRLASVIALGMRGGLLFLGFDPAAGPVTESPQAAKYAVHPLDYGRRLWLSFALTAELTVPD